MQVAWLADGVTIVSPRYSTDYVEPAYDSAVLANQQIIIFPDSRALNGTFRVHLQRRKVALTDKDKPLFPGPQTYMYAMQVRSFLGIARSLHVGLTRIFTQTQDEYSPKSTDYQAHIMRHDVFGVIPQFSLFSTTPKKSSIFTPEWYAKKTTITAHGWIMFISWGIIAPLWAFTARYVKGTSAMWDRAHYYSHLILVGFMTLIAVPIAIYAVTPGKQFDDAHSVRHCTLALSLFR